jgi:glycosyltransferase involved in cell wall biosynthesis
MLCGLKAVFISSLSPGYIAGGSQCTLAFLQAVSSLHGGRVVYVGPEWLKSKEDYGVVTREIVVIPERGRFSKTIGLLRGNIADRVTPFIRRWISEFAKSKSTDEYVVYLNGEATGGSIELVRQFGFRTVFIPHNFAPEYLWAEGDKPGWVEQRRRNILAKAALDGYRNADVRICLTDDDRMSYEKVCNIEERSNVISPCYFAYESEPFRTDDRVVAENERVILINSNLALEANAKGAMFFLRECWPALHSESNTKLVLAGRWPRDELLQYCETDPKVEIVVRPEPAEMEAIFVRASVCLAIAFEGSGIKLRVAEALRRGIPVVATTHCSRGYEEVSPEVMVVDDSPEGILQGINRFLSMDRASIYTKCTSEHESLFSFAAGLKKLSKLQDLLG